MKLSHFDFEEPFYIDSSYINVLVLENPSSMYAYAKELSDQINGKAGRFICDELKSCLIVSDYLNFTINDKKILTKLYQSLYAIVTEDYVLEYADIQSRIFSLLENLNAGAQYPLDYTPEFQAVDLFKGCRVKFDEDATLIERLVAFVKISASLLKVKCLFFVNLKTVINEFDLQCLYKEAKLEDIPLFLIENKFMKTLTGEKVRIIDIDFCEIAIERDEKKL